VDSKAECDQLNLAHTARNKNIYIYIKTKTVQVKTLLDIYHVTIAVAQIAQSACNRGSIVIIQRYHNVIETTQTTALKKYDIN